MKSFASTTILAFLACSSVTPAFAQQVSTKNVELQVNQSTVITLPQGQKAFRLWMDDSAFADVDSETSLKNGASVIYLVPRKVGRTRITILSKDKSGRQGTHTLTLISKSTGESPNHVEIGRQGKVSATKIDNRQLEFIKKGLQVALDTRKVERNSLLHNVLEATIRDIEAGYTAQQASVNNNIFYDAIEKLEGLGRDATPQQPLRQPQKTYTATQQRLSKDSDLLAKISTLEQRVNELSQRQDSLDTRQARLEQEQGTFLAKFNKLSTSVLALENVIKPQSYVALSPGGQGGDIFNPSAPSVQRPEDLLSYRGERKISPSLLNAQNHDHLGISSSAPNRHEIANSLMNGLTFAGHNGQISYRSSMYNRVNSLVRRIRRGDELMVSIDRSDVPYNVVSQLLKWGDLNPALVGLN